MNTDSFRRDFKIEGIISQWIENHFFKKDSNEYEYIRCTDSKKQKEGIDAEIKNPRIFEDNEFHKIDEKAASSYIRTDLNNKSLTTFAFELDTKRKGSNDVEDRVQGWLYGDQYESTEYYLLCWIWADIENRKGSGGGWGKTNQVQLNNIKKAECFLIPKEKIQEYAAKFNVTKEKYMDIAKEVRLANEGKIDLSKDNSYSPRLQHSPYLSESPVNLIIKKEELYKMAIDSFEVIV